MFEVDVKRDGEGEEKKKEHSSGLGFWYNLVHYNICSTI